MNKIRKYLLEVLDEKAWKDFKKVYKEDGLGSNLNEALINVIKNYLKTRKKKKTKR